MCLSGLRTGPTAAGAASRPGAGRAGGRAPVDFSIDFGHLCTGALLPAICSWLSCGFRLLIDLFTCTCVEVAKSYTGSRPATDLDG